MIRVNLNSPKLIKGDCLEALKQLPDNSIDSIVTDPPYGISFMGKKWDYQVPSVETFQEMLRVLKPGGHMLCACGTRTQHRMAVNIEDAGFEIRDVITWLYGSGFPKSMDISKAIDKKFGAEREVIGQKDVGPNIRGNNFHGDSGDRMIAEITNPATDEAKQWQGWGTALKPACEFWTLARKPLSEKTVADNVLKHGTGGINIDGCRIEGEPVESGRGGRKPIGLGWGHDGQSTSSLNTQGRFPANLILDKEAAKALDEQSGIEASRFFYVAKASKSERNVGLDHLPKKLAGTYAQDEWSRNNMGNTPDSQRLPVSNFHPTVKPIKLMQHLVKMITPLNGIVLDPFMGSGSTGVAAVKEGFGFVGIEREESYFEICKARIEVI